MFRKWRALNSKWWCISVITVASWGRRLLNLRQGWATEKVPEQPELHRQTLSHKIQKKDRRKEGRKEGREGGRKMGGV
jgi:hypothetical protein